MNVPRQKTDLLNNQIVLIGSYLLCGINVIKLHNKH